MRKKYKLNKYDVICLRPALSHVVTVS